MGQALKNDTPKRKSLLVRLLWFVQICLGYIVLERFFASGIRIQFYYQQLIFLTIEIIRYHTKFPVVPFTNMV